MTRKTASRNREIFAAHQDGQSIEALANRYGLSRVTVSEIIRFEGHSMAVSADAFYAERRAQMTQRP